MATYLICFSPTGGTHNVLDVLGSEFSATIRIDLSQPGNGDTYEFCETDLCWIGVPCFGGRVPAIAAQRIRQLHANNAQAVLVAVYGNRAFEDTLRELKQCARESGFRPVAAVAAIAEHSILPQFATGRPDAGDQAELIQFARAIREALVQSPQKEDVTVPGSEPYRAYSKLPMHPKTTKPCVQCGLCAAKCPVGAISPTEPCATRKDVCISCMRCVKICPHHARKLNPLLLSAAAQKMKKSCATRKKNELFI